MEERNNYRETAVTYSKKVANRVMKKMMHTEMGEGVTVSHLLLSQKGCHIMTVNLPGNREFRLLESTGIIREDMVPVFGAVKRRIKRYTDYLLKVSVAEDSISLLTGGIYKTGDGMFVIKKDGRFVAAETLEAVGSDRILSEGKIKEGVLYYPFEWEEAVQTVTAGEMKRRQISLRAVNIPGVNTNSIIDRLNYGATAVLNASRKVNRAEEISKFSVRLSQHCAPSIEGADIGTFAVFGGKLTRFGYEYRDGFAMVDSVFMENLANEYLARTGSSVRLSEKAMTGFGIQCRPWMCKTLAVTSEQRHIRSMLGNLGCGVVVLRRGAAEEREQKEFEKLFIKGETSEYAGKLIVITDEKYNPGWIDFFTDLNGLKAAFDINRKSGLNILSVSHSEGEVEEKGGLSTQFFPHLIAEGLDKAMALVKNINRDHLAAGISEFVNAGPGAMKPSDFFLSREGETVIRAESVIKKISPEYARADRVIYRNLIKGNLKSAVKAAADLRHELPGSYNKVSTDPAADFGFRILNVAENDIAEVIVGKAVRMGTEYGVMKRYPGPASSEFGICRFITPAEYEDRVESRNDMDEGIKDVIISAAKAQAEAGMALIPAVKGLLNKHGGMDFDGDGMKFTFAVGKGEEAVRLCRKQKNYAIILR